jgi:hypothetical protein
MSNFEQGGEAQQESSRNLWICPEGEGGCGSELVYPVDWTEEGPRHWRIVLRCPECEHPWEGVFPLPQVEELDEALDRGSSALLGELQRMTLENMEEEVEFFARAIDADIITPNDF